MAFFSFFFDLNTAVSRDSLAMNMYKMTHYYKTLALSFQLSAKTSDIMLFQSPRVSIRNALSELHFCLSIHIYRSLLWCTALIQQWQLKKVSQTIEKTCDNLVIRKFPTLIV